jgi:acetoin utilization protein AcuC
VTSATPVFIGSDIYRGSSYGAAHPLRVPRVSTVMDLCRAMGWFAAGQYRSSPKAKAQALTAFHTADYVAALQAAEVSQTVSADVTARHGLGTLSNPVFGQMYSRPATGVGGVMLAAELLSQGPGVVHVPGGGTHHGLADRANGFCYLNDPVLALLTLRRLGLQRLAYVDIDAHHCDGVEAAFADDAETLLISVHEAGRWPFTGVVTDAGVGNVYNLPVARGFNDTEMRAVLEEVILPKVQAFDADAVVLQCGADALEEDPLSRLCLSNNAHWGVVAALRDISPRFMVLGGGGYNPWSVGRCWAGVWAVLNGQEVPDVLPIEAQAVLAGLSWGGGGRAAPAAHMLTTMRDSPREGPVRADIREGIAYLLRR